MNINEFKLNPWVIVIQSSEIRVLKLLVMMIYGLRVTDLSYDEAMMCIYWIFSMRRNGNEFCEDDVVSYQEENDKYAYLMDVDLVDSYFFH